MRPSAQPPPPDAVLHLACLPGRLRRRRHLLMFVPVAVVGWAWFGLAGSIPVLLWWWQQRPPLRQTALWRLDLSEVSGARLGPWRARISRHRRRPLEIFCDELSAPDLARLRRTLKFQLAAG